MYAAMDRLFPVSMAHQGRLLTHVVDAAVLAELLFVLLYSFILFYELVAVCCFVIRQEDKHAGLQGKRQTDRQGVV